MKQTLAVILLIIATSLVAHGQSQTQASAIDHQSFQERAARLELNKAAQAYRAGKFAEAQELSERALAIDPSNRTAPIFIARSTHAQFRPGVDTRENFAKAHEAIAAYKGILLTNPEDGEAYRAVAALYGAIGENELQYSWILQRADNGALTADDRAEAYVILASKDWNCSFTITTQTQNKLVTRTKNGDDVIVYRKPEAQMEFDQAQQCATQGLRMAEIAITLDPNNHEAWSFKTNLLIEMVKLSEMEGNTSRRDEFDQLATESQARTVELSNEQQDEPDDIKPEGNKAVTLREVDIGSGSGLVGKAISIPRPIYPAIAKTANAQGTVTVEIIVDEHGSVIEAFAASGHPLLRAAAVNAAQQARFSPTILSGQPVKVAGVLTFTFVLK